MEDTLKFRAQELRLIPKKIGAHTIVTSTKNASKTAWLYLHPDTDPQFVTVASYDLDKVVAKAPEGYAYVYFGAVDGDHVLCLTVDEFKGYATLDEEAQTYSLKVSADTRLKPKMPYGVSIPAEQEEVWEALVEEAIKELWYQDSLDLSSSLCVDHEVNEEDLPA